MQLANQTFYLAILVIMLGLMASFFWGKGSQKDQYRIVYWPLSLAMLASSSFWFFLSPWFGQVSVALANISLIAGIAYLSLLFSTWNQSLTNTKKMLVLGLFILSSAAILYLIGHGSAVARIHLMNATLGLLSIWQINSLCGVLKKDKTYHCYVFNNLSEKQTGLESKKVTIEEVKRLTGFTFVL